MQRARITEILEEVGVLDCGHHLTAKATVALWRRGVVGPSLVGELAYQYKCQRDADVHVKARKRADALYTRLQGATRDWLALGVTKTGVVSAWARQYHAIMSESPGDPGRVSLASVVPEQRAAS